MNTRRLNRFKMRVTRGLIFLLYFILPAFVQAATWENIPIIPGGTIKTRQELSLNTAPTENIIYSTDKSVEEIVDFYKTGLDNFGWDLVQANDSQKMLRFSKKEKFLSISINELKNGNNLVLINQGLSGKNVYTGGAGCAQIKKSGKMGTDIAGKDLDSVPRYYGAVRVSSIVRDYPKKRVNLIYTAQANVDEVADFYRQNMPYHNWQLSKEDNFSELPEKVTSMVEGVVSPESKSLLFKGYYSDCLITIIKAPSIPDYLTIGVIYSER